MPYEEIPSFIQEVTYDLTHRKPHVPDSDAPWNESGVIESASAYFCQEETHPQHNEDRKAGVEEGRAHQLLSNVRDGSFPIRRDKIEEVFQKMVEEGVLLLKKRKDATTNMNNHPKYCPFHHLIGHALEDCHGFKSWLHKM